METVATIGFFDGVHKGHQYLIHHVVETARKEGRRPMVLTFDKHPRAVLNSDFQPQLLSTKDEKVRRISKLEPNCQVVVLDFEKVAMMTAREFMEQWLRDNGEVKTLIMGYDNRFGHNKSEGFDDYRRYGEELGIRVERWDSYAIGGINISSSVIRSLLSDGEVAMANSCLGYPYTIEGMVESGEHIGTGIGFPTANIGVDNSSKLIPKNGVYAVRVHLLDSDGKEPVRGSWDGMMNIGRRPTFEGRNTTMEVNLFDFSGDLYGQWLRVEMVERLREERRFRNSRELIAQLRRDATAASNKLRNKR